MQIFRERNTCLICFYSIYMNPLYPYILYECMDLLQKLYIVEYDAQAYPPDKGNLSPGF